MAMKYNRLGDMLVESGAITEAQLRQALELQAGSGERLGTVLQAHGFITERQLIDTLMNQVGVEYVDLNSLSIPSEMAQILPKNVAKKHMVVPVKASRTDVHLAMADPLNFVAVEEVRAITRRRVIPLIATAAAEEHVDGVLCAVPLYRHGRFALFPGLFLRRGQGLVVPPIRLPGVPAHRRRRHAASEQQRDRKGRDQDGGQQLHQGLPPAVLPLATYHVVGSFLVISLKDQVISQVFAPCLGEALKAGLPLFIRAAYMI